LTENHYALEVLPCPLLWATRPSLPFPEEAHASQARTKTRGRRQGLFAPDLLRAAPQAVVRDAQGPTSSWKKPGDVRGRGSAWWLNHALHRGRPPLRLPQPRCRSATLSASNVWLAAHGPLRQLRLGPGRGPWQGPGPTPCAKDPAGKPRRLFASLRREHADRLEGGSARITPPGQGPCPANLPSRPNLKEGGPCRGRGWPDHPGWTGEIIHGVASIDEERHHGAKSAPVVREAGGDRSGRHRRHARACCLTGSSCAVTGPGRGEILPRPHDRPGRGGPARAADAQRDRPVAGAVRLSRSLFPDRGPATLMADWPATPSRRWKRTAGVEGTSAAWGPDIPHPGGPGWVCLIPTTIGALAGGHRAIAGMDRGPCGPTSSPRGRPKVLPVEGGPGTWTTLLLDKEPAPSRWATARPTRFHAPWTGPQRQRRSARLAALASAGLTRRRRGQEHRGVVYRRMPGGVRQPGVTPPAGGFAVVAFHGPERAMSGGRSARRAGRSARGAVDAVVRHVQQPEAAPSQPGCRQRGWTSWRGRGGHTNCSCARANRVLGLVVLEDILKPGIRGPASSGLRQDGLENRDGDGRQPA